MRIPTTILGEHIDLTLVVPQRSEVTRFKATIPVNGVQERMLAPLYAELLGRGTQSKSRKKFTQALEILGAELTVVADRMGITIDGRALSETFPIFLKLIKEMLEKPAFTEAEIAQVHTHYLQALKDEQDDARTLAYNAFTQALYKKEHPYRRPTLALRRTFLTSVTRNTYLDFHQCLFNQHITLSVSGPEVTQKSLIGMFSLLATKASVLLPSVHTSESHEAETIYQSVPSKANIELYIGNTLPLTIDDNAYLAFQFGLAVLGKWGGFSGRLMSTVREKEGLTYSIYARTEGITKVQPGMWYIFTFFTPADLDKGIASTKREIKLIIDKGVSEKEMLRFKELLKNQFILAHESDAKTLALYHDTLCMGMTASEVAAQYDTMQHLQKKQVKDALAQYIQPDTLVISGAGPVQNK